MKFEYIIILVIVFNVVTAYLKRKAKAEKAKRAMDATVEKSKKSPETIAHRTPVEVLRAPEPEWDEEDDGEHSPKPVATAKAKVATVGKGLLEQLARELGLQLPESEPEIPVAVPPRPVMAPPAPAAHFEKTEPRTKPAPVIQPAPVAGNSARHLSPFGLDTRKMREAVILREILDKPVSLRSARFK